MSSVCPPLDGVRVVETADKAEMCGRYLADLGATVIKVEPRTGASSRRKGVMHQGRSLSFAVQNANKRGIALDLHDSDDREVFWQLLASSQLWIESSRPGELDELGLSIGEVRKRCPGLVVLSISDFGQVGPYRSGVATSWVNTAMCGLLGRSGIGDLPPLMPPAGVPVETAVVQASWAAMVGLWNAIETDAGDHIDFSLVEAASQIVDPALGMAGTASAGMVADPSAKRPTVSPYPTYECADGFVRIALLSIRQWRAMRAWLGDPDELMSEDLDGIAGRAAAADIIAQHVSKQFLGRRMMDLVDEAQARGVPCAPVLTVSDVVVAEHYLQRQALACSEVTPGKTAVVPTGFVTYDGVRLGVRTRAPEVGEHEAEIRVALDAVPSSPPGQDVAVAGDRPLSGLRVLDLGIIVYGAEVTRLFADLGADVIKVENSLYPDGARVMRGPKMSRTFVAGHRGKRSIGLNLRSDEGRSLFLRLVEEADIVFSNFKPGTLESLGLGYATLADANPNVVVVTASAMGASGPWATWMGYGPLVRCATGLASLWRYPEDVHSFADLVTVYPDHYAARVMATAGLAAVIGRRRSGRGAHVEGAQAEAVLMQLSDLIALESLQPGAVRPQGNTSDEGVPWGLYQCAGDDEWCVITVQTDDEWQRFCRAAGFTDFEADNTLATIEGRFGRREEIEDCVRRWVRERSPRQVQEMLQAAAVPAGAMLRVTDYRDAPHLAARGHLLELVQPNVGTFELESGAFLSDRIATPTPSPAPRMAEHTREVMAQVIGLDTEEIDRFIAAGVLEEHIPSSVS